MGSGLRQEIFQNFRGLNRTSDRLNAPPDFLFDLLNGYVKKDVKSNLGIIQQRDGSAKFNTVALGEDYGSTKSIKSICEVKWDGGSTDILIRAGTAWGKFDGIDTFDSILTGTANDAKGQGAMFKNEFIFVDGGIPHKLTSAGAVSILSADADMPQDSDAVWVNRGKVWLNSQANPMIAYFCTTNSANGADSWSGATDAGTIDLSTILPTGDRIRAFRNYGGFDSGLIAIICDKYTVIFVAGANVYTFTFLQLLPTNCISVNALDYVGTDIVYPSRDSLTSLFSAASNNQLEAKPLSNYINNLWRDLTGQVSDTTLISGAFNHKLNHYYITFPLPSNYQTLVYSTDIGNFVGRWVYPFNIYSWCERRSGVILAGSDSYVYTINTGSTDNGTTVNFKVAMPALYFKDAVNYKKPIEFEALVSASSSLDMNIDYWYGISILASDKVTKIINILGNSSLWEQTAGLSGTSITPQWNVTNWNMEGNAFVRTSDLMGRGKVIFLEIRNQINAAQLTLYYFRIGYIREGVN